MLLARSMATPAHRPDSKYNNELESSYSSARPSPDRWYVAQFEKPHLVKSTGEAPFPCFSAEAFNTRLTDLLNEPGLLEEGEPSPSEETLAQIRGVALWMEDQTLKVGLPEISVYFGEVDLTWKNANRLLRLIAYPETNRRPMTVYQQADSGEPLTRGQLTPVTSIDDVLPEKFAWLHNG